MTERGTTDGQRPTAPVHPLAWCSDLLSPHRWRRWRAVRHQRRNWARFLRARGAYNATWMRLDGPPGREHPEWQADRAAMGRVLPDGLRLPYSEEAWPDPWLHCALVYLEWEARYPKTWTREAKGWGYKEEAIRALARHASELPDWAVQRCLDLVLMAVQRQHRCKDGEYAKLGRALARPELRRQLGELTHSPEPHRALRARYLLWVLENPAIPRVNATLWRHWLQNNGMAGSRVWASAPRSGWSRASG